MERSRMLGRREGLLKVARVNDVSHNKNARFLGNRTVNVFYWIKKLKVVARIYQQEHNRPGRLLAIFPYLSIIATLHFLYVRNYESFFLLYFFLERYQTRIHRFTSLKIGANLRSIAQMSTVSLIFFSFCFFSCFLFGFQSAVQSNLI